MITCAVILLIFISVADAQGLAVISASWAQVIAQEDGRQVGTQWVDDVGGEVTGTPVYPIIEAALVQFMPSVDGSPDTELVDVNLLAGQTQRRFS